MSEQAELNSGAGEQPVPQAVGPAAAPKKSIPINVEQTRDEFIENAQPVADALRKRGRGEEAAQLEQAAKVIEVAVGTQPVQQPGRREALKGETVATVLKNIWEVIDRDPELKKMPQAQRLRKAGEALDGAGLLDITVRNGVVVSFVGNFVDNFRQVQQAGPQPIEKRNPAIVLESAASAARAPQRQVPNGPPGGVPQEVHAKEGKQAPAAAAPTTPQPSAPAPTGQFRPQEIIYAAAPPLPNGVILKDVLSSQAAHYSVFQIQVDSQDPNKAILLPAPGADGQLINSLSTSMPHAYTVSGKPEADKPFLRVQTPTQLERTPDGWKVTAKGTIGFSATQSAYQAPAPRPALDLSSPPAVQQKVASLLSPAVRAQAQALAEQNLANRRAAVTHPRGFTREDIPFDLLAKMGVQAVELEKSGQLQKLLEGKKTDLIPSFFIRNQEGEPVSFSAKLVLIRDAQGVASLHFDLPKHQLHIPEQMLGQDITPRMKEQLQKTGVVLLPGPNGQSSYLTVDKEMNKVVAVPSKGLEVPRVLHGVTLQPAQHQELQQGRPVRLENLVHQNRRFAATLQLDPLKRTILTQQPTFYEAPKQAIAVAQAGREEAPAPRPRQRL